MKKEKQKNAPAVDGGKKGMLVFLLYDEIDRNC